MTEDERRKKREEADAAARGSSVLLVGEDAIEASFARIKKDLTRAKPVAEGTVMRWTSVSELGNQEHWIGFFTAGSWSIIGAQGARTADRVQHGTLMDRLASNGHRIVDLSVAASWKGMEL